MQERRQTRVLLREGRLRTVLLGAGLPPRDRYTTDVRLEIQDILMEALDGVTVDYTTPGVGVGAGNGCTSLCGLPRAPPPGRW